MGAAKMEQKTKNVSPFSNESRNAYVVEHLTSSMLALLGKGPQFSTWAEWAGHRFIAITRQKKILSKCISHIYSRTG